VHVVLLLGRTTGRIERPPEQQQQE
jgi:hypothetical protein